MKHWLSGVSKRMHLAVVLGGSVLLVWALAGPDNIGIESGDSDGDNMADSYELFYGLDPGTNDAALAYDGDLLSNLEESRTLTDPFSPDTDFDGWPDDADAVPISRAYLPFGAPLFTRGDFCEYARPDWCLGSWKTGGAWFYTAEESGATNQNGFLSGWQVSSSKRSYAGLSVALDRSILTNNLVYAIHYWAGTNALLYADLLDSNNGVVAEDLYGNLLGGGNAEDVVYLAVPTAQFPDAAIIRLRVGRGGASAGSEIRIHEVLVYISEDGDEWDADQERQLGTSDYSIDSNGNGISDYEEWLNSTSGGSSTNLPDGGGLPPPGGDGDDGGQGGGNNQGIIYVDRAIGDDTFTGRAQIPTLPRAGTGIKGPKKTVRGGLSIAEPGNMIIIKSGTYNEDLNIMGKDVNVFIEGNVKL